MSKLLFQETRKEEVETIVSIENDGENSPFIFPNSAAEHTVYIEDEDISHLLIRTADDEIVGFVILAGLRNSNRIIELRRIVIHLKGQGYGRATLREVKKHCFEKMGCHRLWLDVLEDNSRARHLYQSEGFVEEGKLRECIMKNGEYYDLIVMSILKSEYN